MKRKIIAALIIPLILILVSLVSSCAGNDTEITNNNDSPAANENLNNGESIEITEEKPNTATVYTDDLGDFNFNGHVFSMITRLNPRFT